MNKHYPEYPFENVRFTSPKSWACIDCGIDTAPGIPDRAQAEQFFATSREGEGIEYHISDRSEIYMVEPKLWKAAGMEPMAGCLCIGCLEKRIGRTLVPRDFLRQHSFHLFPGTKRLLARRDGVEKTESASE